MIKEFFINIWEWVSVFGRFDNFENQGSFEREINKLTDAEVIHKPAFDYYKEKLKENSNNKTLILRRLADSMFRHKLA